MWIDSKVWTQVKKESHLKASMIRILHVGTFCANFPHRLSEKSHPLVPLIKSK